MIAKKLMNITLLISVVLSVNFLRAQDEGISNVPPTNSERKTNERFGENIRGSNALTLAVGSSVINGDFPDPMFEFYFHAGYKRYLGRHVNINLTYHKFNLAYKDLFNNGFMSFDLNLEWNLIPDGSFSPYIFAGGGYHAANYFENTHTKVQGGAGVEYLVLPRLGLKLFADYNHIFDDELDGRIFGESDDIYWRMGFGINMYFGEFKDKSKNGSATIIESNPIDGDK